MNPIPIDFTIFAHYPNFVASRAKILGNLALDLHHATTGMSTEAGEALSTTKKLWIYGADIDALNKEGVSNYRNLVEEIGDMLFYIQHACNLLQIDMGHVLEANMTKLEKRYPKGYSDSAALARADKTE